MPLICHRGCARLLQVTVLFAGLHISKSPFEVEVGMAQGDSSKATAQGPGLEPVGNIANKSTYFDVYTAGTAGVPLHVNVSLCGLVLAGT